MQDFKNPYEGGWKILKKNMVTNSYMAKMKAKWLSAIVNISAILV